MSDTPRTDSEKYWLELHEVVEVDFARQLERENASLRKAIQDAADQINDYEELIALGILYNAGAKSREDNQ